MTVSALHPRAGAGGVGETLGVEEEYHLVDRVSYAVAPRPELAADALAGRLGPRLHVELQTSQLEMVTGVCRDLGQLRAELVAGRAEAEAAAAGSGATILGTATHPFSSWPDLQMVDSPRYAVMTHRFGALARKQDICGCHVHVGVPDLETAVAVLNHARPYLPLLVAMTASSPFHDGVDTGYDSYRAQSWTAWPMAGPPPRFDSAEHYLQTVDGLVRTGIMDDASTIYWDLRPSHRYPTLEFRIADVCTSLDDAVLHAALVRSLAATLADRAASGTEPAPVDDETLRAARWRAARYGLAGDLLDPTGGELVNGRLLARRLLLELEPQLRAHGDYDDVRTWLRSLLHHGSSASRQRAAARRYGDLRAVVRAMVGETLHEVGSEPLAPPPTGETTAP
jgi:YbdK family carboxylate-amine ligase